MLKPMKVILENIDVPEFNTGEYCSILLLVSIEVSEINIENIETPAINTLKN